MYNIRIHAIRTANDDGSQYAVQTADQIEIMIKDCNKIYGNSGIQFVFDKQKDFESINSSLLNHDIIYPSDVRDKGVSEKDGTHHVIYRGVDSHIYELFSIDGEPWRINGISRAANAPPAIGNPSAYTMDANSVQHVIYRSPDGNINELWAGDVWKHNVPNIAAGAPKAAGDPVGYTTKFLANGLRETQHIIYRAVDGNIHELFAGNSWKHNVPNIAAGAPKAAGDPFAYTTGRCTVQHIVYRGDDGHIHELFAGDTWKHNIINLLAGAPKAKGNPSAYTTAFGEVQHVVYRGVDDRIHELFAGDKWRYNTISSLAQAPLANGDPVGYATQDYDRGIKDVQHVVYRAGDGHIHELLAKDAWKHNTPTLAAGASQAAGDPFGYTMHVGQYPHIIYKGVDGHIHELFTKDAWKHNTLTLAAGAPPAAGDPFGYITRIGEGFFHAAERDKVALAHRGKLVVYFRYGDSLGKVGSKWKIGPAGLNFSNPLDEYVAITGGEIRGFILAHEIGHYLHIGHTFAIGPKNIEETKEEIKKYIRNTGKDKSLGLNAFDADIDYISDTPPDPGPDLFESYYGAGSKCDSGKGTITLMVNFDDGSAPRKYEIKPDRSNIMSYFFCPPCHLSKNQIAQVNSALKDSNRSHLIK